MLSELVGNVVRHAGTPMTVTLTLRRPYLQVAVADDSRAAARVGAAPDPRAEGGRGLLLVREPTQALGQRAVGRRQGGLGDAARRLTRHPELTEITALA
ncbi:ATP-binding protein [Micromonospora sp. KC207]|uniref:ATP-binding protein n=1 Tax=Micromonospora sp. KC207 TaxID=2530377 RepID=UPI001FB5E997|nr:ATP-binding protein [Micromonospora sp. KC207]